MEIGVREKKTEARTGRTVRVRRSARPFVLCPCRVLIFLLSKAAIQVFLGNSNRNSVDRLSVHHAAFVLKQIRRLQIALLRIVILILVERSQLLKDLRIVIQRLQVAHCRRHRGSGRRMSAYAHEAGIRSTANQKQ